MNFGKIVARPSIYAINKLVTNLSKQDSYTMINLEKVVFYSSRYFFKWKIWCKFWLILWFSAATKVWQSEFNHIFLSSYCKMTFILFFTQVIIKIFFKKKPLAGRISYRSFFPQYNIDSNVWLTGQFLQKMSVINEIDFHHCSIFIQNQKVVSLHQLFTGSKSTIKALEKSVK